MAANLGRRPLQRFLSDRTGAGAVEFAFLTPILLIMSLLTIDLGLGGYQQMQVQSAAQAGAEYAVVNGFSKAGILSAVKSATPNANISTSPDPAQFCACSSSSGLTPSTCGATCNNGKKAGTYASVFTATTYNTIISYPGFSNSYALSGQATVRLQ